VRHPEETIFVQRPKDQPGGPVAVAPELLEARERFAGVLAQPGNRRAKIRKISKVEEGADNRVTLGTSGDHCCEGKRPIEQGARGRQQEEKGEHQSLAAQLRHRRRRSVLRCGVAQYNGIGIDAKLHPQIRNAASEIKRRAESFIAFHPGHRTPLLATRPRNASS
jgi:hypothetical protein